MNIDMLNVIPLILFFISFFGLITGRNIIKSIVYILLMQTSVVMAWLIAGSRLGTVPPIIHDIEHLDPGVIADPLPQALMITAIIIGVAVMAVNIVMLNFLLRKYSSAEWKVVSRLARENEDFGVDSQC